MRSLLFRCPIHVPQRGEEFFQQTPLVLRHHGSLRTTVRKQALCALHDGGHSEHATDLLFNHFAETARELHVLIGIRRHVRPFIQALGGLEVN